MWIPHVADRNSASWGRQNAPNSLRRGSARTQLGAHGAPLPLSYGKGDTEGCFTEDHFNDDNFY